MSRKNERRISKTRLPEDERERQRVLTEAYLVCRSNLFWQFFIDELSRKNAYLRQRLAEADSWEEVCRLRGSLALCHSLLQLSEEYGKGEQA